MVWKLPVRYMLMMAGKLAGFRSKKNSGGLPGTNLETGESSQSWAGADQKTYSSQFSRMRSMVAARISLPSLVAGYRNSCTPQFRFCQKPQIFCSEIFCSVMGFLFMLCYLNTKFVTTEYFTTLSDF